MEETNTNAETLTFLWNLVSNAMMSLISIII